MELSLYQWAWPTIMASEQQVGQQPLFPPKLGAGSSNSPAPVYIPLRGKRPKDAPFEEGKDPAPKKRREACL